ncbi:hypothetical protein ACIQNU_04465 [Streptomyces sp. NPDC091292]|uniref:hypothetical protein n=1 Tax=Streptomyces sp. NPDC091292 TaxID=3365991 RepID=UPI0037F35F6A
MSKPNRKVIRLQQMRAQRAEAAGIKYVDVVFENEHGYEETCTLLTQDNWPVEVIEEVEGKGGNANINVLREIASPPEAFDRLVKVAKLTVGELKDLIDQMDGEAGTDQGEGSGSSPSSESTPGASAPTSSATTPAAA